MPDLETFVDTVETRLGTIAGLRVYRGPLSSINEFPCAIIEDADPVARYTFNSNEAAYYLTITVLEGSADAQESWERLDSYLSASGAPSIRAAVDLLSGPNMTYIHVVSASRRKPIRYAGGTYWGAVLTVEGRATIS